MSFRRYVLTLMCVYLAVATVAGVLATVLLLRFDDLRADVGDLRLAQLEAVKYESSLLDQESGARGFVITGDDRLLDPYENGLNEQREVESTLRALVDGDVQLERALDDVAAAATAWREQVAEPEIAMRRVDEAAALDMVATGSGRTLFEESRAVPGSAQGALASSSAVLPEGWISRNYQRPAEGVVAGDCFSVELLSPDLIGLIVIDISGHGADAGATGAEGAVDPQRRSAHRRSSAPRHRDVVGSVDGRSVRLGVRRHHRHPPSDRDPRERRTPAGHRANGGRADRIGGDRSHRPAAAGRVVDGFDRLAPGDLIIIATDGLTEARRPDGEFYGEERLREVVVQSTSDNVLAEVIRDIEAFLDGHPARDDITVVTLRLLAEPAGDATHDDAPADPADAARDDRGT